LTVTKLCAPIARVCCENWLKSSESPDEQLDVKDAVAS